MLGWPYYRFVIFVLPHDDPEILFMVAVAHALCVGYSSVFTRSCRPCTEVDMHSTLWQSRHRVSGTEGCPLHIHSGPSIQQSTVQYGTGLNCLHHNFIIIRLVFGSVALLYVICDTVVEYQVAALSTKVQRKPQFWGPA